MSLYKYEFKKLLKSRLCVILFALLIGLNFLFGLLTYDKDVREDNYSERFVRETDNIIYNAKMNYISIENKESENAQYQLEIIRRYSELLSLDVRYEVSGYDDMLSSPVPFVSALLFAIIAAMMLTYQEHSANLIMSSFHHGRIKICFSKIFLLLTVSFAGLIILLTFQAIGAAIGNGFCFSGASAPVQCISAYIHCPYRITVIQALLLRFLLAFITAFVLSLIVFLFGIITRKSIWPLLFTALLFGIDYLLTSVHSEKIFSIFYQLNIGNFITDNWLFRYSGKKLFCFMSQLEIFGLAAVLSIALLTAFSVCGFRYAKVVQSVKSRKGLAIGTKQSAKNFLYYEVKKMWSIKVIAAIALLLALSLVTLNANGKTENRDLEKIYRYYIDQMSDLSYEEQVSFSFKTKISLNQAISEASAIRDKYINGEETHERYAEVQQKAGVAELELDVLRVIDQQLNSIGELNKQGIQAKLIYSTGWKKLIQNNNHLFLLFAVVLLIVPYVTFEKESGINAVLSGIFKGNRAKYRRFRIAKFFLALVPSMMVVLLFYFGELLLFHLKYGLNNWTSYAAGADILFYIIKLRIVDVLLLRLLFSVLGVTFVILLAEVLTLFFKKSIFVVLTMTAIELPWYIILTVIGHLEWNITSYFGFDLLYLPPVAMIIQISLPIMLLSVGLWIYHHFKNAKVQAAKGSIG